MKTSTSKQLETGNFQPVYRFPSLFAVGTFFECSTLNLEIPNKRINVMLIKNLARTSKKADFGPRISETSNNEGHLYE